MSDTPSATSNMLRAIIQASPLAIVTLGTNDQITMWNPAAERVFGWSEAEVLGHRPPFVPDDRHADFLAVRERERVGENLNGVELRRQRKDGTPIDVRLWTAPMRDAAGRITDVVGMLEDVTDRRQAEAALRESEAQRDAVLQTVSVVLYRALASGPFASLWVSGNVERLTGFPAARFKTEASFWASRLHPEDRETVFKVFGGLEENASATYQYRWQCADGTYRWFLDQAYLRQGTDETPTEFLGTWLDITERKEAEILVHAQRDLALALASTNALDEGLRRCLDTACEIAHLDAGGFYLADETTGVLDLRVHRGLSPAFVRSVSSFGPESPHMHLLVAGKPVYVAHRNLGLPLTEAERQEGLRFLAVIPVLHEGRVLGCINIASHVVESISAPARAALEATGAQIGQAIAQLRTEAAFRASNERFQRLVADTDTGFVIIDESGVVLEANDPYARLAGYARMEAILDHSVMEWTAPEERDHNAAAIARCVRQGQIQDFETIDRHPDGRRVHVLINAIVQQRRGAARLVSYCRDITERKQAEAALALRTSQLDAIRQVSAEIVRELNLGRVLALIHQWAMTLLGADGGLLYLWDEATQRLIPQVWRGVPDGVGALTLRVGEGLCGVVAERGAGLIVNDYRTFPHAHSRFLTETEIVAALAEPLRFHERLVGVITVHYQEAGHVFTGEDQNLLNLFADHAAIAIENARLHDVALRRAKQLEALNTVTQAVRAELSPQEVTRRPQRVLEGVQALCPGAASMLLEQLEDAETLRVAASLGFRHSQSEASFRLHPGEGLAGIAMATRQAVVSNDLLSDPRFVNQAWAATEGLVAGLVLPLVCGDRVTGVLGVFLRCPHTFASDEVELLQAFAAQCAIALENARLFEQVYVGRAQLGNLTRRVVSVHEEELHRLSRELHDHAGQALTALRMSLDLVREELPSDAVALHRRVGDAAILAASITNQVRGLAQALRPPALDRLGLHAVLEGYCREWSRRTGVIAVYTGRDLPGLPDEIGIQLYRLVQEALTNVAKYAQVDAARVELGYEDGVISLAVADDGGGFDPAAVHTAVSPQGLGLIGMRERIDYVGGELAITSQVGQGTRLLARVPWKGASA